MSINVDDGIDSTPDWTPDSSDLGGQPYPYRRVELVEPDWTRFPGWKDVTAEEWASAQWQRAHCVKNLGQLRDLLGDLVDESFYADLGRDQAVDGVLPRQLTVRRGVEVEPAHPHPHLVVPDLAPGVEPLRGLRERSCGSQHPVRADRVTEGAALDGRAAHAQDPFIVVAINRQICGVALD